MIREIDWKTIVTIIATAICGWSALATMSSSERIARLETRMDDMKSRIDLLREDVRLLQGIHTKP